MNRVAYHFLPIVHDFFGGASITKVGSRHVPHRTVQVFASVRSRSPITDSLDFCLRYIFTFIQVRLVPDGSLY